MNKFMLVEVNFKLLEMSLTLQIHREVHRIKNEFLNPELKVYLKNMSLLKQFGVAGCVREI